MARRSSFRTTLAALSLVILGAAIGITADRLHAHLGHAAGHGPRVQDLTHAQAVDLLEERVALEPGQRERIIQLLDSRQASVDSAWEQAHRHILATVNNVIEDIAGLLEPDQLPAFRALVAELHGPQSGLPLTH